jgi:hypothetical protein
VNGKTSTTGLVLETTDEEIEGRVVFRFELPEGVVQDGGPSGVAFVKNGDSAVFTYGWKGRPWLARSIRMLSPSVHSFLTTAKTLMDLNFDALSIAEMDRLKRQLEDLRVEALDWASFWNDHLGYRLSFQRGDRVQIDGEDLIEPSVPVAKEGYLHGVNVTDKGVVYTIHTEGRGMQAALRGASLKRLSDNGHRECKFEAEPCTVCGFGG